MATSGNIDKSLATWLTLRLRWEVTAQSTANNTSTLKVTALLITGGGNLGISDRTITLTINGTTYTETSSLTVAKNTTKTLFTKTVSIAHNANGSKSVALACSVPFNATISGSTWGTKSVSGTATLPTILRNPSTFTRTGTARMGQAQTINITRASSSFTHKLYYTWVGVKTLIASNVGTSHTWTPPVNMAASIPNTTSGTCTLTCETYSGSTLVGSTTLSFTLSIPADAAPTIGQFTLTDNDAAQWNKFGVFINNKSKAKMSINASGDAYGSTVKTFAVSIAGQNITGAWGTASAITKITEILSVIDATAAGKTYTATATITDSRGRTASKTATFTIAEYLPPQFTILSAERCLLDGTLDDDGECLSFSVAVNVSSLNNKNTAAYALEYKPTTESEYTPLAFSGSGYSYSDTTIYTTPTFSTEKSYNVRFSVTDYFGTVYKNLKLSTAKPIIDILADGSGIAFNKVAEISGLCDIGFPIRFYEGIENLVAEKQNDLNDLTAPNTYVTINKGTESYANLPKGLTGTFTIEVLSAGAEGQIFQRITTCNKTNPLEYIRHYYQGTWGEWIRKYGVTLYSNASGSNGEITLSESCADFRAIDIHYTDNNGKLGGCFRALNPNGKTLSLSMIEAGSGATTYFRRTTYTVSENTITPDIETAGYVRISTATPSHNSGTNYIKITSVIGYHGIVM